MSDHDLCPLYPPPDPVWHEDGSVTGGTWRWVFQRHRDCECPALVGRGLGRKTSHDVLGTNLVCVECGLDLAAEARKECDAYDAYLLAGPRAGTSPAPEWRFACPEGGQHKRDVWEADFGRPHRREA